MSDENKQGKDYTEGLTEAPFSASVYMRHPSGAEVLYSIRSTRVDDGVKRIEKLLDVLIAAGYQPTHGKHVGGGNAGNGGAGGTDAEGGVTVQDFIGFKRLMEDDKVSYKMPFLLNDGNEAEFPKILGASNKKAIALFETAMRAAGIDPDDQPIGKLVRFPFKGSWRQGKEIPKKDPAEKQKYYTDWLSFEFERGANRTEAAKHEDGDEIPF